MCSTSIHSPTCSSMQAFDCARSTGSSVSGPLSYGRLQLCQAGHKHIPMLYLDGDLVKTGHQTGELTNI